MEQKIYFSREEMGLTENEPTRAKDAVIATPHGFFPETNPAFSGAIINILESLSEKLQMVFPPNVSSELQKMGIEENYEIKHDLIVDEGILWRTEGKELDILEFGELNKIRLEDSRMPIYDENRGFLYNCWFVDRNHMDKIKKDRAETIKQLLQKWAGNNKCIIDNREFLVIEGLDRKLEEMEELISIESLYIRVTVIRKGVGDAICQFSVFISPDGEIGEIRGHTHGAGEGEWETMIGKDVEGHLSFEEAIKKLEKAAEELERKTIAEAIAEANAMEGLKLLFA